MGLLSSAKYDPKRHQSLLMSPHFRNEYTWKQKEITSIHQHTVKDAVFQARVLVQVLLKRLVVLLYWHVVRILFDVDLWYLLPYVGCCQCHGSYLITLNVAKCSVWHQYHQSHTVAKQYYEQTVNIKQYLYTYTESTNKSKLIAFLRLATLDRNPMSRDNATCKIKLY